MPTLQERNEAYVKRCCDWHWGDSGGRGDRDQPCQNPRPSIRRVELARKTPGELDRLAKRFLNSRDNGAVEHVLDELDRRFA